MSPQYAVSLCNIVVRQSENGDSRQMTLDKVLINIHSTSMVSKLSVSNKHDNFQIFGSSYSGCIVQRIRDKDGKYGGLRNSPVARRTH